MKTGQKKGQEDRLAPNKGGLPSSVPEVRGCGSVWCIEKDIHHSGTRRDVRSTCMHMDQQVACKVQGQVRGLGKGLCIRPTFRRVGQKKL